MIDLADRTPAPARPRDYPHHESLVVWLVGLGRQLDPPAQLRQLLPLVEASLSGAERLALHQRLWQLWRIVDADTQTATAAMMDGRYTRWCEWMSTPWTADATWQHLTTAHLEAQAGAPLAPDYVLALLDARAQAGAVADPRARWLAVRARIALCPQQIDPAEADRLIGAISQAQQDGAAAPQLALAAIFDLAVRAGAETVATQALLTCVAGGGTSVAPTALRRWLEGAYPLALAEHLQAAWLRPRDLRNPAWLAALAATLQRPEPITRLNRLFAALQGEPSDSMTPLDPACWIQPLPVIDMPAGPAWRALRALDGCYALAEQGALPEDAALGLIDSAVLAPQAVAALCRALALQAMDRADAPAAARALARARAAAGDAAARSWLAGLLRACDDSGASGPVQLLSELLEAGSIGAPDSEEIRQWQALRHDSSANAVLRSLASAMVARACQEGRLEPGTGARRTDLAQAKAIWTELIDDPGHQAEARRRLARAAQQFGRARHAQGPGREHLWVAPATGEDSGKGNGELLIVPSCLDSRHTYAQVRLLQQGLPGHHLLFVNNPEFDWYSDTSFDHLVELVRQRVAPAFAPEQVTCYYGSMGGHGALKLALQFGYRAVLFNPQIDLDLWALFRPNERQRLLAAERHARPAAWPDAAWAAAPVYIAVGSFTADRLALASLIGRLSTLANGRFIVEKFADRNHAGLINRIPLRDVPVFVQQASQRLAKLRAIGPTSVDAAPGLTRVPHTQVAGFWRDLDGARSAKVEIVLIDGCLYTAPSLACGTISAANQ